jgi:hypothetical protein
MRIRFDVMDAMEPEYSSVEPENERQESSCARQPMKSRTLTLHEDSDYLLTAR